MIDHDKKIVFVHVPKCAGNAVYNAIKPGTRGEHVPLTKWYGRNINIVEKTSIPYQLSLPAQQMSLKKQVFPINSASQTKTYR